MMIACVLILGRLSLQCPEIISYFTLQVWSKSLFRIGFHSLPKYHLLEIPSDSKILSNESEISDCIELYHIICTCVPLNSNLVTCLIQNGITEAILTLSLFVLMSAPLATPRQLLIGICHELLLHSESSQVVAILEQIITFGWKNSYQLTDSGGIEIQRSGTEEDGGQQQLGEKRGLASFVRTGNDITTLRSSLSSLSSPAAAAAGGGGGVDPEEDYLLLLREALLHQESLLLNSDSDDEGINSATSSTVSMVQKVMERTRSICQLFLEISPEDHGLTSPTAGAATSTATSVTSRGDSTLLQIPSQLFLRMLRGYLEIPSPTTHHLHEEQKAEAEAEENAVGCGLDDVFISTIPSHLCGIIVLVMKSHISLDTLLHNGEFPSLPCLPSLPSI
jgi:hypothetical protein